MFVADYHDATGEWVSSVAYKWRARLPVWDRNGQRPLFFVRVARSARHKPGTCCLELFFAFLGVVFYMYVCTYDAR